MREKYIKYIMMNYPGVTLKPGTEDIVYFFDAYLAETNKFVRFVVRSGKYYNLKLTHYYNIQLDSRYRMLFFKCIKWKW